MRGEPSRPRVLIPEERIEQRVAELAAEISRDHAGRTGAAAGAAGELLLVGVLRGSFIFLADLARRLTVPCAVDFIAVASYGGAARGDVRLVLDVRASLAGRHVLVVEDIVDSGHTLDYLLRTFRARNPASLRTCVLTRKPAAAEVEVPVDYLGFEIPDAWVVGYGLDLANRWRTLPYIGVVEPGDVPGGAVP
ncbi:MAG TPA: hypoxanthine phosphoribosyltransferase [Thermoanaerobaculia bacterium]|nr:hypoxanthine phosphoribosyltransferase [Thermoanaerobaculia bacterium]